MTNSLEDTTVLFKSRAFSTGNRILMHFYCVSKLSVHASQNLIRYYLIDDVCFLREYRSTKTTISQ